MKSPTRQDGRHERSEATRKQLLEAAAPLFAELGYPAATLERITTAAGVHKALVGYHFGGKLGLYRAVLREGIATGRRLLEPVRRLERPAAERLDAYVDALGALFRQRPHFAPTIVREWMSGGTRVDTRVMAEFLEFFRIDQEILEAGVAAGELRDNDPNATHLMLVGSLVFFEITRPLRGGGHAGRVRALGTGTYHEAVKELLRRGLST